jgi:hypothetical protein
MYETLTFAPTLPFERVKNVDEATNFAMNLTVNPIPLPVGDLKINEDGTVTNSTTHKVTKFGFESLCSILKIPHPFARNIPNDLLFENIRRLQQENSSTDIVLLEREDGDIANIVKAPYSESSYLDILSTFASKENIEYIEVGERLLTIALTFKEVSVQGPDNNPFYVGNFIYSSILKKVLTHFISGFYRTQCSNSYLCPFMGKVTANYMTKDPNQRLLRFSELVERIDTDVVERVSVHMNRFQNRTLYDDELMRLFGRVSKVVSYGEADVLLKTSEEERKTMFPKVMSRQTSNKRARLLNQPIEETTPTLVSAFDAINNITSYAQKLYGIERRDLERIGGEWLGNILLN